MKKTQNRAIEAFTITELLVVIAVVCAFILLAIPSMARTSTKSVRMTCINNLRQVAIAFKVWEGGNSGFFPQWYAGDLQHPLINSANPLFPTQGPVWPTSGSAPNTYTVYLAMSNELSNSGLLKCPADSGRSRATNFYTHLAPTLRNNGVSYFVGEATTESSPRMLLSGDRNIAADTTTGLGLAYGYSPDTTAVAISPGSTVAIGTNVHTAPMNGVNFGWTSRIHKNVGNVAFADGSVQQLNNTTNLYSLKQAFSQTGDTNTSGSPGPNQILFP